MTTEITVELESAVGPRVLVAGEVEPQEVLSALPQGWTVHDGDWSLGVKTDSGRWSYPLSRPTAKVAASNPQPSDTGVAGTDVDVVVTIGGREYSGSVTLLPAEYDGRPSAWGAADNWVSGGLLASLRGIYEGSREGLSDALGAIEAAAREVIPGAWKQGRFAPSPEVLGKDAHAE